MATSPSPTPISTPVELYQVDERAHKRVLAGASWVQETSGSFPSDSLKAGEDLHDINVVARVHYKGGIIPGNLYPKHGTVHFADGNKKIQLDSYEVLTVKSKSGLFWIPSSNGERVQNAVVGGRSDKNELLFIGRAKTPAKFYVPGEIVSSQSSCIIPGLTMVYQFKKYEILVALENHKKLPEGSKSVETVPHAWKSHKKALHQFHVSKGPEIKETTVPRPTPTRDQDENDGDLKSHQNVE